MTSSLARWFFPAFLLIAGCQNEAPTRYADESEPDVEMTEGGSVTITDRTGKIWDITHAVSDYGFRAEGFQYGLGPNAISPAFDPVFAAPGDESYPAAHETFSVLAAETDGDPRAYRIWQLARHEVIDEWFGETAVAVAY